MAWNKSTKVKVIFNLNAGFWRGYVPVLDKSIFKEISSLYIPKKTTKKVVFLITKLFNKEGISNIDFIFTKSSTEAKMAAQNCIKNRYDLVVACGGDGTLHEIINVLANTKIKIGILPLGSTNSVAMSLGIPFNIQKAMNKILKNNVKVINLSSANGRYFLLCLGVGLDAWVVRDVKNHTSKKRLGFLNYLYSLMKSLYYYTFPKIYFESRTKKVSGDSFIFLNLKYYAGKFKLAGSSTNENLGMTLFEKINSKNLLLYIFKGLRNKFQKGVSFSLIKENFLLFSQKECYYHLDGEFIGKLPLKIEVNKAKINILT